MPIANCSEFTVSFFSGLMSWVRIFGQCKQALNNLHFIVSSLADPDVDILSVQQYVTNDQIELEEVSSTLGYAFNW